MWLSQRLFFSRPSLASSSMPWRWVRHWDISLLMTVLALLLFSFVLLYSASNRNIPLLTRHSLHAGLGFLLLLLLAPSSPEKLKQCAPYFYGLVLFLLFAVVLIGTTSKGAQRWIALPGFRFQPSEFMKIALPLWLASFLSNKRLPLQTIPLLQSLLWILLPVVLIAKQPDLGTALLVACAGLSVLFFAGLKWRWILSACLGTTIAFPIVWWWILHDYQRKRILTFLYPENDPLGSGYHIIQSKIAIGSGGLYGKGFCQGTQAQLNFLPERTTDFIFSVLGEEFGFLGVACLCLLYLGLLGRTIQILLVTPNTFSRLLIGGITFSLFACIFMNIGMVSSLLPVVGCPLPFISYGGTSLITWMTALGMLMANYSQRSRYAK